MQILSAVDALSPAYERTKLFLYSPFRKGRTWKLSITAYLAYAGSIFLPFPLLYIAVGIALRSRFGATVEYLIIAGSLVMTAIVAVIFILCGRVQFAFFDMVLNRGEFVAPAWRKYGPQSWRWTWIKMLVGTVAVLLTILPAGAVIQHFVHAMPALALMKTAPGEPPPPQLINLITMFYGAYFVFMAGFLVYSIFMTTVSSFVVPSMALENASFQEAFRRFWGLVRRETAQLFLFVVLRWGVGILISMVVGIVAELAIFLLLAIFAVIAAILGWLLHLAGVPVPVLLVIGGCAGALFLVGTLVYFMGLAMGPYATFSEAYTLYFLGGRYPLLGELLERSTPPPPPPAYWPGAPAQPGPLMPS